MNCMNCGSSNDVIDLIVKGEKLVLCADCRYKLANEQKVVTVARFVKTSLNVTKEVSLTLPAAVWEHLDRESDGNSSEYLRKLIDRDMWSQGDWSNNAALGYVILAAKELGYPEEQISKLVRTMYRTFDYKTIDEAKAAYEQSPY